MAQGDETRAVKVDGQVAARWARSAADLLDALTDAGVFPDEDAGDAGADVVPLHLPRRKSSGERR